MRQVFGAFLVLLACLSTATAQDGGRGLASWRDGAGLDAELGATGMRVTGRRAACAGCHGADAQGGSEGGLRVPALTSRRLSLAGLATPEAFATLLHEGLRPDGTTLHPIMPRYVLAPGMAADLLGFLAAREAKPPAGVTTARIALGLVGEGQAASRVRHVLTLAATELNRQGGIWGRKVEFVPLGPGDIAPDRLAGEPVLAVLAPTGLAAGGPGETLLARLAIPCIFPLRAEGAAGCTPSLGPDPSRLSTLLTRGLRDQLGPTATVRVLGDSPLAIAARAELGTSPTPAVFDSTGRPDAVLAFGAATVLKPALAGLPPGTLVFGTIDDLAPLAATGGPGLRLRLGDPRPPGDPASPAMRRLRLWLDLPANAEPPALERTAYAAFLLVGEALRRAGHRLGPSLFVHELAAITRHETGLLPSLDFATHPREGYVSMRLIGLDPGKPPAVLGLWTAER